GEQLVFFRPQVQDHVSAACAFGHRLDGVLALASAFPADSVLWRQAGAPGYESHAVGDYERRVEADAELADEVRIVGTFRRETGKELARPRPGDRPDVLCCFLERRADAVVGHGDGAG